MLCVKPPPILNDRHILKKTTALTICKHWLATIFLVVTLTIFNTCVV